MNGNCHFIYGAAVGSALAINLDKISSVISISNSSETATLLILGGLVGGIFPDIDNPSSYMGRLSTPVSSVIGLINKKLGKVGANHRGILHDPIVYILGLVLSYFFFSPLLGFFVGCLSHIFLDMFNPKGVPCLFLHRIRLGKFESGDPSSVIFTWVCVFIVVGLGLMAKFL